MNEQLKHMLRTAWEKAEGPSVQETMFGKMTDFREELMDELENVFTEFAELIIRECLSVTKKQYNDTLPWGGVEDTIKEHFGVEE